MATDKHTIQSYNDNAKKWAEAMRQELKIAHKYIEKPSIYSLLPDIKDKAILCVGCGTGEECEYLKRQGAKRIVGIDISEGMIGIAKESFPDIEFKVMDMENMEFKEDSFDYIFSSLTIHYVKSWEKTLKECYRVIKNGGQMAFSTQHPAAYNSLILRNNDKTSYMLGYSRNLKDRSVDVYGNYFDTEMHEKQWPGGFKVAYFNRPISQMVNEVLESGFKIIKFEEPKPIDEAKQVDGNFYKIYSNIPLFATFLVQKSKFI